MKSDFAIMIGAGSGEHVAQGADNIRDHSIVAFQFLLKLCELGGKFAMGREHLAETNKGAHNKKAHFNGTGRMENLGGHERSVLGKNPWEIDGATVLV